MHGRGRARRCRRSPSSAPVRGSCTGRGRTGPRVQAALVVLGGEQLHRGALDQRGADRVRADRGLGPDRALGEAQRVGPVPHPVAAVAPQHDALGVGDDHDVLRLVGDRGEAGPQPGQHAVQRAGAAALLQRLDPDRAAGRRPVGIVPVGAHPRPRPRHDGARAAGSACPVSIASWVRCSRWACRRRSMPRRTAQTASSTAPSCAWACASTRARRPASGRARPTSR